jgi:toxin ParE1/3/4
VLVIFTAQAEADLENIADHIAVDSPRRALSFISELRSVVMNLATFPNAYPIVPRYERHGVRRKTYGEYLIFYVAEPNQLSILHILHGAQDYEAILFPDNLNSSKGPN